MKDYEKHLIEYTKGKVDDLYHQRYITGQLYSDKSLVFDLISSYDNWLTNVLPLVLGEYACKLNDDSGMSIRVNPRNMYFDKPTVEVVDKLLGDNASRTSRDLYPKEARDKLLTYAVRIRGDYNVYDRTGNLVKVIQNKTIGEVPCMVGSAYCHLYGKNENELLSIGECSYDPFGYFIIKGREFTLNIQANLAYNCPIIYTEQDKSTKHMITTLRTTALTPTGTYVNNIKLSESRSIAVDTIIGGVKVGLNPFQVMRILKPEYGELVDEYLEMMIAWMTKDENRIKIKTSLSNTIRSYRSIPDDFMDIVQKRTNAFSKSKRSSVNREIKDINAVIEDLDKYLYPHMNQDFFSEITRSIEEVRFSKIMYLMYNVALYLQYLIGDVKIDDRNNWATKQACNVGIMFQRLFLRILKNQYAPFDGTNDSNKKSSLKDFETSYSHLEILEKFVSSFENNIWIVATNKRALPEDKNVVLEMERNIVAHYSALKRINIPSSGRGGQSRVRGMHLSQLRFVCIWETPEGDRSGLVMSQGSSAVISLQRGDILLQKILIYDPEGFQLQMTYNESLPDNTQACILNGRFVGFCNAEYVRYTLTKWKSCDIIDRETGIYIKNNALFITTMGGRLMCPTLVVGDGHPTGRGDPTVKGQLILYSLIDQGIVTKDTTYDELTKLGCIEYMEPSEQEQPHVLLAQTLDMFNLDKKRFDKLESKKNRTPEEEKEYSYMSIRRFTHCEITPNSIIGIAASIVPLPHHNQPARNVYQAAMGKQAQGIYHSNICNRIDRETKMLVSPSRPIFSTEISSRLGLDDMPAGETVTLAITMDPFSQEDALTFKKGAIDRGLFSSITYKTHKVEVKLGSDIYDRLTNIPDPNYIKHKQIAYRNLHHNGLPIPGTYMEDGDCLIGIIHHEKSTKEKVIPRDISIYLTSDEAGVVEKLYLYKNSATSLTINIKVRSIRTPIPGDKFAARHAQKGTMSIQIQDEDMPFDPKTGVTPDIIYNTHGMPSRMTIGMINEIAASNVGAVTGRNLDASGFETRDVNMICRTLHAYGYSYKGTTVMYDGYHGGIFGKEEIQQEIDENGEIVKYVKRSIPSHLYVGRTYYQRLKHEVIEKGHERGLEGRHDPVTRLPTGGSDDGAIRFGEMERDALISHGSAYTSNERLIGLADKYTYVGCIKCGGTEGKYVGSEDKFVCLKCKKAGTPYAFGKCSIPFSLFRIKRLLAVLGISFRLDMAKSNPMRPIPEIFH